MLNTPANVLMSAGNSNNNVLIQHKYVYVTRVHIRL